jgi:hypothetical protein
MITLFSHYFQNLVEIADPLQQIQWLRSTDVLGRAKITEK